jgi:hypothetical protein
MSLCRVEQESDPKFKVTKKTTAGPSEESVLLRKVAF